MTQAVRRSLPVVSSVPNTDLADEQQQKMGLHEDAAHEKRNWVRLSYDCNNHCSFCLDTNAHDGTMRDDRDIRVQIVEGRKKGATRLILSGGEPTMHPLFLDYVLLGRRAGYPKIQTVTNGRMFAYPDFMARSLENGLSEITFSLHGHTAKLHDALVGTPGAFVEETAGLKAALKENVIVNVDIVINKQNVRVLPEMLETFISWGVQEFDLLHIIPFGNAWTEARHHLFYDLDDPVIIDALRRAFEYSRRPDVHIWLNRFPPPHTEGFEELIQDPYKLNDEVRGRREEFDRYLSLGQKLSCREPERCKHCYLQSLCDTLDEVITTRREPAVDAVRVAERSLRPFVLPPAKVALIVAPDLATARALAEGVEAEGVALELEKWDDVGVACASATAFGRPLRRVVVKTCEAMAAVAALPDSVEIAVQLDHATATALLAMKPLPARYVVVQPNHDRVTDARAHDVDLHSFFEELGEARTENVPACLSGVAPEPRKVKLDAAMLGFDGRIEMPRYAQRYIETGFYSKSIRCKGCKHDALCDGVHINWVRAHGYAKLTPVVASAQDLSSPGSS